MPRIGLLYPGHSAEDDYPALQARLDGSPSFPDALELPLVHTSVGEDAHRVDALLDLGGEQRLADGARVLVAHHAPDSVMWACTSGSFVFGWDSAHEQVDRLARATGLPTSTTSLAFVDACRAVGVTRVSVAASLDELENAAGRTVLTANQVTVWKGLDLLGEVPKVDGLGRLFQVGS